MKKKILFKIGTFPLLSETFVVSQIIMASKLGFEVKILVNELSDIEKSRQGERIKAYSLDTKIIIENYRIPENKLERLLKFFSILLRKFKSFNRIAQYYHTKSRFSLSYLFQFDFYDQFKNYNLIHIQYGTNAKPIDDLKKSGVFSMPVITTFHGHDAFFPINGFIPKKGYYDKLFESTEKFTSNTPYLANQLIQIDCPKEKILTIPVPVDTSYFYKRNILKLDAEEGIKLLSVGRLESIKGHELGIKVIYKLVKEGYNVYYDIIGEGKSRNQLELLIKELNLEKRVRLLGARSQKQVRQKYWASHIFLMTSTAFNNLIRETQGLVSLEAQACGVPVVAFDSGGVKYTIENGKSGIICEEANISQMVQAIKSILNDPLFYKSLSARGPEFVEDNFSNREVSKVWKNLYEKLTTNA